MPLAQSVSGHQYHLRNNAIGINLGLVYENIRLAADAVASRVARDAYQSAVGRVPVRKVFKGGRKTYARKLTGFDASGRPQFEYLKNRYGGRIVSNKNKANNASSYARRAVVKQGDTYKLKSGSRRLNYEGRKSLATAKSGYIDDYERYADPTTGRIMRKTVRVKADVGPRRGISFGQRTNPFGSIDTKAGNTLGGNLKNSIKVENLSSKGHIRYTVFAGGPRAPYAKFVEFGTRRTPEQAFLRPALKKVESRYPEMMRSALRGLNRQARVTRAGL